MKREMLIVSLLALATAHAAAAQEVAQPFTGPSLTLVAGYDHAGTFAGDAGGFLYGGSFTYDLGSGNARFGLEAEATGSTAESCKPLSGVAGGRACSRLGRDLYIGGRAGAAFGSTLVYGKAGYTNARTAIDYRGAPTFTGGSFTQEGYRLGAGIEHALGSFLVRAEYRYSDYSLAEDRHQVTAGVGIRF